MKVKYAFRCANCYELVPAGHAGERQVPLKCPNCGKGAGFDPETGLPISKPDNWIVLSDLPADDLKQVFDYHGIGPGDIEKHTPTLPDDPNRAPVAHDRAATEGLSAADNADGATK